METSKTSFDRRLFAGLLLIIAGGLLLLDSMNILPLNLRYYIIDWRTLLIFIGIIALSNRENRTTGWILIGIGLIFWLPAFYYIRLRTIFWPVVLIGLGLLILSRKTNHRGRRHSLFSYRSRKDGADTDSSKEYIDEMSIFGGGDLNNSSDNFKGGRITAIFGGSEINLMSAIPSAEGSVIDVFLLFGGSTLIVPNDWQVKSEVSAIFGGLSDKRLTSNIQDKQLIIRGLVLFGGLEIKSY